MNPVFQEGCRADGSDQVSITWRGGDGLQVCQETPGHPVLAGPGQMRGTSRSSQRRPSQWYPFPRGVSIMNPLRSAGLTPGSELAVRFTLGKLRGTQTSVSSRSSREAGLHHREEK